METIYSQHLWDLLDSQSSVQEGSPVKKQPTVVELSLLVSLALVVVIVYGVREFYVARAQRDACHRANLEKLSSARTLGGDYQHRGPGDSTRPRRDRSARGTDDETVIQRRDRMIDGVKLKLTKVNKDRAENQRRTEQIQSELSSCLAKVK